MSLGPLYVFLGEVSVQVLCPFFNWVVCLPGVESGSNLSVHQQTSGSKNYGIFTQWNFMQQRKEGADTFARAWMELESILLSEISQAVRDKYHMISPLTGT